MDCASLARVQQVPTRGCVSMRWLIQVVTVSACKQLCPHLCVFGLQLLL